MSSIVIIGGLIWIMARKLSRDDEYASRENFVINFASKYCMNHAYGIEKGVIPGKHNRTICSYEPLDVMPEDAGKVLPQKVVLGSGKRVVVPNGDWSGKRNLVLYLPANAEDMPEAFKRFDFGGKMMDTVELLSAADSALRYVRDGSNRKDEILSLASGGEITKDALKTINEVQKDINKLSSDTKESRRIGPPPPTTSIPPKL